MTVLALIVLVVASILAAYFGRGLPAPWPWVVYGVLVVLWILVFIWVAGIDGGILGQRISGLTLDVPRLSS
jgi:hypothetical protein